jgi:hypothetical protein
VGGILTDPGSKEEVESGDRELCKYLLNNSKLTVSSSSKQLCLIKLHSVSLTLIHPGSQFRNSGLCRINYPDGGCCHQSQDSKKCGLFTFSSSNASMQYAQMHWKGISFVSYSRLLNISHAQMNRIE